MSEKNFILNFKKKALLNEEFDKEDCQDKTPEEEFDHPWANRETKGKQVKPNLRTHSSLNESNMEEIDEIEDFLNDLVDRKSMDNIFMEELAETLLTIHNRIERELNDLDGI